MGVQEATIRSAESSNATEPALRLTAVSHARDSVGVLQDIGLSSDARRIGVVGRNGSGKSSLARLVVGLERPDAGTIRVFGGDVAADRAFALQNVGMIFQNPDQQIIFPTVAEEIRFGMENLGWDKPRIERKTADILNEFGAGDWAAKPVYTLSHGQKHLVCLLSVLAMEPRLVVLDEPYVGLDIPTASAMRRLLDRLSQHIMLISHDPADFDGFDELIWLDEGMLKMHGRREVVLPAFTEAMHRMAQPC